MIRDTILNREYPSYFVIYSILRLHLSFRVCFVILFSGCAHLGVEERPRIRSNDPMPETSGTGGTPSEGGVWVGVVR